MRSIDYKMFLIIFGIVLGFVILGVFRTQVARNGAINLEEQIATAYSNIDVQQKRRADLIPNLVDCVKDYNEHEYETLIGLINARNMRNDAQANEVQMLVAAVAEAYPELKSNSNYKELMNELSITENLIANYRNNYNFQVRAYKNYVRKFPNNVFINLSGYEVKAYDYLKFDADVSAPTNLFN